MAAITNANVKNGASPAAYLQNVLNKTVLENLEPELYFYQYGKQATAPTGAYTVSWARFDQLTRTVAQATLVEGTTPTEVAGTYTVVQATPAQYGIHVIITDLLLKTAPTSIVTDAGREIAANMGRIIDQVVQAELVTGTNVIYANGALNRAALASTDVVTGADLAKATTKLRSLNAKPISMGCYVGIVHSFVAGNIRNTSSGLWLEANKYVTNETILNGETGKLDGIRIMETSNVTTIASTTTVYPSYILGVGAYGVTDWQSMETFYETVGSGGTADPLHQRATVGGKVAFAAKILQQNALLRIESGATAI